MRVASQLAFQFPELRPGTMLKKDGSSTRIPGLPDMRVRGNAWVVESTPTRIRIYEETRAWGVAPTTFDQVLELRADGVVDFAVRSTAFGAPLPVLRKQYRLTDARDGWMQLSPMGDASNEPAGYISARDGWFEIDLPGPLGTHDTKRLPIIQPGAPGYVSAPTPPRRAPR